MKKLESFDEYKKVISEFRLVYKRPFSNIYFMPDDIKRYIELGRAGYKRSESGIIFFFDEETYYRACLYVSEKEKFKISSQKKKILVKNIYPGGEKKENLQCVEQRLMELGFRKVGTHVDVQGETEKIFRKCGGLRKYAEGLEKKGYQCIAADYSLFKELDAIIMDTGIIKNYQLNYRTDEEKKKLESGSYLCIINDSHQVCAVNACVIEGDVARGVAMAVKEKYKMHGLAPVLTYYRFKWLCEHGIKYIQAWILLENEPSLRYYRSLGYEFLNKYADEWILEEEK